MNSPITIAGTTPMMKPATMRHSVTATCSSRSPLIASCQNRTAMSLGAGTKRRSPKPSITSACQTSSRPSGEIR